MSSEDDISLSDRPRPDLGNRKDTREHSEDKSPPSGPPSNPSNLPWYHFETLSLLAFFSLFGVLARLGLTALFDHPGATVFPVAWVQGTGCFLFGLIVHRRRQIERIWPALYVGLRVGESCRCLRSFAEGSQAVSLTLFFFDDGSPSSWYTMTGFAGGIATFATWQLNSFVGFSNLEGTSDNWLSCACDGLSYIWITVTVVFFSINFGRHLSGHLPRLRLGPLPQTYRYIFSVIGLLGWLVALLIFILRDNTYWRVGRRVTWALVLAPIGTWIRWWAGSRINPISPPYIKFGTFGCNMASTSIAGVMYLLQRISPLGPGLGEWPCQALQGVQDGFCGCLSTIPAFIEQAERMHDSDHKWATPMAWFYLIIMYGE